MAEDAKHLVEAFERARELLLRAARDIAPEDRSRPCVGHWDVMDVLAHCVGWDYTNIAAIEDLRAGRVPAFYARYDPGWASYNAGLVTKYAEGDWDELIASLARSQAAIGQALRSLDAEELTASLDVGQRRPLSIAGIMNAAIRDEQHHTQELREFAATGGADRHAE